MGEFDLIDHYFKRRFEHLSRAAHVLRGIGDDCAVLAPQPGMQLCVSTDMLVEGRHFLPSASPEGLGHKSLAVNLSDLAACGAQPIGFTLALALPSVDDAFLDGFSRGLLQLATEHGCPLVGGDTTAGPLTICITVFGEVPTGLALLRSGAQPGDDIYVSGQPGEARLALEAHRGHVRLSAEALAHAQSRMDRPTPRVALGLALRAVATAAIDVSDGLLGDLRHLLKASKLNAELQVADLPNLNHLFNAILFIANNDVDVGQSAHLAPKTTQDQMLGMVLAGGDDYELVFTAPPEKRTAVLAASAAAGVRVSRIGRALAARVRLGQADAVGQVNLVSNGCHVSADAFGSFDHFG